MFEYMRVTKRLNKSLNSLVYSVIESWKFMSILLIGETIVKCNLHGSMICFVCSIIRNLINQWPVMYN